MRLKTVRKFLEMEADRTQSWWDDSLESDGMDLQDWGFCQGYFEESEA